MVDPTILDFINSQILLAKGILRRCITVPIFIEIRQSVAEIQWFFDFQRWRPSAILDSFGTYLDHHEG